MCPKGEYLPRFYHLIMKEPTYASLLTSLREEIVIIKHTCSRFIHAGFVMTVFRSCNSLDNTDCHRTTRLKMQHVTKQLQILCWLSVPRKRLRSKHCSSSSTVHHHGSILLLSPLVQIHIEAGIALGVGAMSGAPFWMPHTFPLAGSAKQRMIPGVQWWSFYLHLWVPDQWKQCGQPRSCTTCIPGCKAWVYL